MPLTSLTGAWRLESLTRGDRPVHTGQSHLVVRDEDLWELWPDTVYYDDEPGPVHRYALHWEGDDGRLEITVPGRPAKRGIARLFGDELQIRWGAVAGRYPDRFFDERGSFAVFVRERDPDTVARLLEPPARVERAQRSHPVLGALGHDARLGWWTARVRFGGVDGVTLYADGALDCPDEVFDRAAEVVARVDVGALRAYAASRLYGLYDANWRREDGPDVDEAGFARVLAPESLVVSEAGTVSVSFADGDLFWGHSVIVTLDRELSPIEAEMAG